ncbi:hypothetical protein [Pandoravirus japonicus]|uniref:Uncharacterized protein n=1 Tax=Pandoravirus japonicus TaxID=2823154 RepID=A0A811BS23_9VIRU|nr:hypothetical protein [Pandoravirus japonicus]
MAAARQRVLCLSLFLSPCFALCGRLFVSFFFRIGRYKKIVPFFFSWCRETAVTFVVGPALVVIPVRLCPFFSWTKEKNQQDIAKARSPGRVRIARGVRIVYFSYLHTISSILSSFFFFRFFLPCQSFFLGLSGRGRRWPTTDQRAMRSGPTSAPPLVRQ